MTSKISIKVVAADANVLLSAAAGRAARRVFMNAPEIRVVTTEANLGEVREYLPRMASRYGIHLNDIENALTLLPVEIVAEERYSDHLEEATQYLGDRDPDDVALAALALSLRIPIWSNDRDFEEVPLTVYSTARLLKALGI